MPSINDKKKRLEILQVLFSVYQWDTIKLGGVGAADCAPEILTSKTTSEERVEIVKWAREIMPKGDSWSDGYHRETLGRLLLDLEADILDDETYLKIRRETGRLTDLIDRLLQLKRVDEAIYAPVRIPTDSSQEPDARAPVLEQHSFRFAAGGASRRHARFWMEPT